MYFKGISKFTLSLVTLAAFVSFGFSGNESLPPASQSQPQPQPGIGNPAPLNTPGALDAPEPGDPNRRRTVPSQTAPQAPTRSTNPYRQNRRDVRPPSPNQNVRPPSQRPNVPAPGNPAQPNQYNPPVRQ